jgi:hypothetical protein
MAWGWPPPHQFAMANHATDEQAAYQHGDQGANRHGRAKRVESVRHKAKRRHGER